MTEFIPRLPDLRQPPDDPRHYLLNHDAGWRIAKGKDDRPALKNVEESPDGALQLAPQPGTGRPLADDAGTFGGLALPTGVAITGDGSLFLLDAAMGQLKRFDPCQCRFESVPCTGGLGAGPRQVSDPHGIAIRGGDLFICDTGNWRVQIFALKGMTLRAIWLTPAAAAVASAWQPYDLVFDVRGRAFISDFANGVIHRFDRLGRWQIKFGGLNQPTHLAIDRLGKIYVAQAGLNEVWLFDADGKFLGAESRSCKVARDFCATGVITDAAGHLHLGESCDAQRPAAGNSAPPCSLPPTEKVFDAQGNLLVPAPGEPKNLLFPPTAFAREGIYLSLPLDSEIYRCQWHRIVIEGDVPIGATVQVETFTAEKTLDDADLDLLPELAWRTRLTVRALSGGAWDCLITSPPGRYLYLRLRLRSNGAVTPRLARVKVCFPRISLRRYLPAVFGENPVSADFTDRLLAVFDTTHRSVEEVVDNFARYLDPMATPCARDPKTLLDFLTWLGSWMGLGLDRSWGERRRRRVVQKAHCLHRLRGTAEGLRLLLLLYLGWEPRARCGHARPSTFSSAPRRVCSPPTLARCACRWQPPPLLLEHFRLRRWLFAGEGRLGGQSVLWGKRIVNRTQLNETAQVGGTQLIDTGDPLRDPFHVYAHKFSVFIPAARARTDAQRATLQRLIALSKPAHTVAQLELVEPRFRIGFQSSIGFDSVVGCYPKGFSLDSEPLGVATVLAGANEKEGSPTLDIGQQSRIGTSTIVD